MKQKPINKVLIRGDLFRINDPKDKNHNDFFLYDGMAMGHLRLRQIGNKNKTTAVLPKDMPKHKLIYRFADKCHDGPGTSYFYDVVIPDLRNNIHFLAEALQLGFSLDYGNRFDRPKPNDPKDTDTKISYLKISQEIENPYFTKAQYILAGNVVERVEIAGLTLSELDGLEDLQIQKLFDEAYPKQETQPELTRRQKLSNFFGSFKDSTPVLEAEREKNRTIRKKIDSLVENSLNPLGFHNAEPFEPGFHCYLPESLSSIDSGLKLWLCRSRGDDTLYFYFGSIKQGKQYLDDCIKKSYI